MKTNWMPGRASKEEKSIPGGGFEKRSMLETTFLPALVHVRLSGGPGNLSPFGFFFTTFPFLGANVSARIFSDAL